MGMSESRNISKSMPITFRKVAFGFGDKKTKRYWHNDSPFLSTFWSALSAAFPEGEKFFMDSGRHYRHDIKDEDLKKQLSEFVRQEAHHTMHHKALNSLMDGFGFDMDRYDGWFGGTLGFVRKHVSQRLQLSASMSLEHFTANFAHQYLASERFTQGVDPEINALWKWHAVEEIEHKGVLFDIYEETGGGYLERVVTLPIAWAIILAITFTAQAEMLAKDGKLLNVSDNLKGLWYLAGYNGMLTNMIPSFIRYFKPDFHPWDENDKELIDQWVEKYSGYIQEIPGQKKAA